MEKDERYEAGLAIMKELFSEDVRAGMVRINDISPDLWKMIVSFGFGELYSRKTLTLAQQEMITLTALLTQGAFEQLKVHLQGALNSGLTKEEIIEVIIHCVGYVGFPKAVQAMNIAGEVF